MRLLQLNPNGSEENALDLHPMLTVVTGLSPAARESLLDIVTALPKGIAPSMHGLVECHGIFLDLDAPSLALLDLSDANVDVRLRPEDIRTVLDKAAVGAVAVDRLALQETPVTAEEILESSAPGVHPELDHARAQQADAREALSILRDAVDRAMVELEGASSKRRRSEAALLAAKGATGRPGLRLVGDDQVASEVQRARILEEIAEFEEAIERATRGVAQLKGLDVRPLQVLLEAIQNPEPVEYVTSDRARQLADEFEALQARVESLEASVSVQGLKPSDVMTRLEQARGEVKSAERAMQKPNLSNDDVAELETAHEAVLEAERKASGGIGKRAAQKRYEDALEAERTILDRVGFPTWSAYVMGAGLMSIDPVAEERLNRAKFDMEEAETLWAQVTVALEDTPEHHEVLDQIEGVYLEAVDLLGGDQEGQDIAAALRELKVAKREVTMDELVYALAYQLKEVGIDLGPVPLLDVTVQVAEVFLEEAAGVQPRIAELQEERTVLEQRLAVAERELIDVDAEPASDEAAVIGSAVGDGELAALAEALAVTEEDERDMFEFVEAREALMDAAIQMESVATGRVKKVGTDVARTVNEKRASDPLAAFDSLSPFDESSRQLTSDISFDDVSGVDVGREAVEFYLLARLAALRSVSYGGSVPMVVDDALVGIEAGDLERLLDRLDKMADAVQVIYLTDDPVVIRWAERRGFERAAVVPAPAAFSS